MIEEVDILPAPLSRVVVGGSNWVILAKQRKPVRIVDLAMAFPATHKHLLFTPEGDREVQMQIGPYVTHYQAIRTQTDDNENHTFITSAEGIWLKKQSDLTADAYLTAGVIWSFRPNEERLHNLTIKSIGPVSRQGYEYTLTPGSIYLGAGQKPLFLPFWIY